MLYEEQPRGCIQILGFSVSLELPMDKPFDFTYFVIRFDLGVRLFNPALSRNQSSGEQNHLQKILI